MVRLRTDRTLILLPSDGFRASSGFNLHVVCAQTKI